MAEQVFVEYKVDGGYLYRVNVKKGSYMLFKDQLPVENFRSEKKSVMFSMHYVVFLGKSFEMNLNMNENVHLLPVKDGLLQIPFRIFGVSDVRHFLLPVFMDIAAAPVILFHFKEFSINTLRRYLIGEQFFVVDTEMTQFDIARLRMRFPGCRVVLYREDEDRLRLTQESDASNVIRATDLVNRDERGVERGGVVFMARLHLRKLEWLELWKLPADHLFTGRDVSSVLAFLGTMLLKIFRDKELEVHQERLRELEQLFVALRPVFLFKQKKWQEFLARARVQKSIAEYVKVILTRQAKFRQEKGMKRQHSFLLTALNDFEKVKLV